MALPPWLQISPRDYLAAVEAGTRAGLSIREANQQAWENAQRMQLAQENAQRQDLANRLQQERLDQYRQQELANARSRIGESQNALQARIALGQQGLALRSQGLDEAQKRFEESQKTAKEREDDRQAQREFRNKMAEEMLRLRQEGADRSRGVPHYVQKGDDTFVIQPGSTNALPVAFPKSGNEDTATTGSTLGSLFGGLKKLGAGFIGSGDQSAAQSIAPAVSKRVRVKGPNGETGTIPEGTKLPEGWTTE